MFYTLTPLTEHTGLEFRGLDLTEPLEPEIRDALNRAFVDYQVLVIRGQRFTPPQFIGAAEVFGELQPHDKKELHVPGYPQINYVSNEQIVRGKRYISGETFHTDHSNHPPPPKATLLYPVSLPTTGGDTHLAAYALLFGASQQGLTGLVDRQTHDEEERLTGTGHPAGEHAHNDGYEDQQLSRPVHGVGQ